MFSSGDNGDNFNLVGFSSSDYPTESPYVTSVGGTSLQIGSKGQQTGQVGWATGRSWKCTANAVGALPGCTKATLNTWLPVTYDGGSGGFTSYYYTQPWYQAPVVPAALALRNENIFGPVPLRVNPDISMDADPATGFLIGLHQTFPNGKAVYSQTRYGGTSLASPLLAGVIADADQAAGVDVGFINPAIYRLDSTPGAIDDILPGASRPSTGRTTPPRTSTRRVSSTHSVNSPTKGPSPTATRPATVPRGRTRSARPAATTA